MPKVKKRRDYEVLRDLIVDLESIDTMLLTLNREGYTASLFIGNDDDGTSILLDKHHVKNILTEKRAHLEGELDTELVK